MSVKNSLHPYIFPQLRGRWVEVDLNHHASLAFSGRWYANPLLNATYCEQFVKSVHQKNDCDYSYGGYEEGRECLWRGHYMKAFCHLGIDYNVPSGTAVHALHDCRVISLLDDQDEDGGWGRRIIFETKDGRKYLYGHLNNFTERAVDVGDNIQAGSVVGTVGDWTTNGNWYPHLHVQCIAPGYNINSDSLDGYGESSMENSRRFPDPEKVLMRA